MLKCYRSKDLFWIRFFGHGFYVKKQSTMLFSERNGFKKGLRIGKYYLGFLTPNPLQ